jgi:arsenate reductase (thioredoxin)
MKKILFVCTGNSCRSQMAEGIAKKLGWNAFSAGAKPEKEVNPIAIEVMNEIEIDISNYKPKLIENIKLDKMDIIMTVCNNADKNCPIFPDFNGKKTHYSFEDPANKMGTKVEKLIAFRRIRNEIFEYLNSMNN